MPFKLRPLWEEGKTRNLFKTHLVLFLFGGAVATLYSVLLPATTAYRLPIVLIPLLFTLSCIGYLLLLPRPNLYFRFLIFTLEGQLAASIFMALTGGFLGIVQFAPFMFLLFAVFELGADATVVLGIFSVICFIGIAVWSYFMNSNADLFQQFFYYMGSYILIVVIERNIGKELSMQFEAKRRLEEVDDLKNQFITLVSHYLRTPITVIKGISFQLHNPTLEESANQLEVLTEKFLTITSIEKGRAKLALQRGDLVTLLKNVVSDFQAKAQQRTIKLDYQSTVQELSILYDPSQLKQAIAHLIDNAIEYNKPGGSAQVSLLETPEKAIITISDTGEGIEKERLENLFSAFNRGSLERALQVSTPGLGLGLYTTKLIIEAHKGIITATSELSKGTKFIINLPRIK